MNSHWYIAIVANNTEKVSAEKLGRDFEVYLPTQRVTSIWKDGRRKQRDRVLLPGKLLVRCTEQERAQVLANSFVSRFMVDIAARPNQFGRRPVAIVPDSQVERLRFVLGQEEAPVTIDNQYLQAGETVRILRGPLQGLEAQVAISVNDTTRDLNTTRVFLHIDHLGNATVQVNLDDIERI